MLRTRIFLNLIPFIVILIAVGAYALFLFSRLANTVDQTITVNYHSDAAAVEMMLAVERMDAALDRSRKEEKSSAKLMFDTNRRIFEEKLQTQITNVAVMTELTGVVQLQTNLVALQRVAAAMFSTNISRADQDIRYNETITLTDGLKRSLNGIREEIRKNIFATGETIQHTNSRITSLLILGLGVAVLITFYASFKLGKAILKPIQTLTNAAREIGQGNLDQTVPVLSSDELGELAVTFNKMAGQLNMYRQSTTEQIIRLHRTMEAALASFSDPVFIMDRYGRIELSNRAAEELSAKLLLDGALPPKLAAAADNVLQRNQDFLPDSFDEVIALRLNGQERAFLPRLHIMREADAKPVGVAVVLHDVTRFRLLDDAKTNLVATVSHELKTPLTSVRMVLHLLLEKSLGPINAKQEELLATARKDSERLLKMLDALLDIARLEAGASPMTKEKISPAQLVQTIREEVQNNITNHGLKLVVEVEPSLPDVLVDRQQIGPVFHNFISNAIKHSPPGGKIQIAATAAADGSVQFSVSDEGAGIAEQHLGLVFDRFYRVPGQTKRGVGLGLSIAREIVIAHGGRVGVRSQIGRGSEFFFVLEGANLSPNGSWNGRGGEI
jgi:NtrC-family two-component system sensor histidine kinase KinB